MQAARAVPVESPVIGSIKSPVKGTIVAATAPDGSQTIDLAMLKQELTDLRDKITQILGFFPANLKLDGSGDTGNAFYSNQTRIFVLCDCLARYSISEVVSSFT